MTAQQKAIFTIVYFLVMLIPSYLSRRKIWAAVCKACGTTPTPSRQQVHKQEKAAHTKCELLSEYREKEMFRRVQQNFQKRKSLNANCAQT